MIGGKTMRTILKSVSLGLLLVAPALPLRADVTLLHGSVVDTQGNVYYRGTTKNFSVVMATASDLVIAEAEKLVEPGELDPDLVMTPCLFVDYIVVSGSAK